jgi:hypothetical protein
MAFTLLTHTGGGLGSAGGTSAAIDTSGADFLVAAVIYDSRATPTFTDSKGNTWTAGFAQTNISNASCQPYWCNPTSKGTGHTVACGGPSSQFSSVYFAAFSGALQGTPKDQAISNVDTSSTCQPGSLTPTENNELVICICAFGVVGNPSIAGGGMILLDKNGLSAGAFYGGGLAYVVQSAAAAINPTWTFPGPSASAAESVSFKSPAAQQYGLPGTAAAAGTGQKGYAV